MTRPVTLVLELDGTPLSSELQGFVGEMVALSGDKLNSVAVDAAGLITAVDGASAPAGLVVGEPLEVVLPGEGAGSGAAADAGDGSTSRPAYCRWPARPCACASPIRKPRIA